MGGQSRSVWSGNSTTNTIEDTRRGHAVLRQLKASETQIFSGLRNFSLRIFQHFYEEVVCRKAVEADLKCTFLKACRTLRENPNWSFQQLFRRRPSQSSYLRELAGIAVAPSYRGDSGSCVTIFRFPFPRDKCPCRQTRLRVAKQVISSGL